MSMERGLRELKRRSDEDLAKLVFRQQRPETPPQDPVPDENLPPS